MEIRVRTKIDDAVYFLLVVDENTVKPSPGSSRNVMRYFGNWMRGNSKEASSYFVISEIDDAQEFGHANMHICNQDIKHRWLRLIRAIAVNSNDNISSDMKLFKDGFSLAEESLLSRLHNGERQLIKYSLHAVFIYTPNEYHAFTSESELYMLALKYGNIKIYLLPFPMMMYIHIIIL